MRRRYKEILILALMVMSGLVTVVPAAHAEVIDRIVARVNGRIILQSDLNEAMCYEALLSGRAMGDFSDDDRRAVLDRLIDQELLQEQMKSASFQHASEAEAARQITDARKQYPEGVQDESWQALLGRMGLNEQALLAHVKQEIDLMRLVDAHLRPTVQIDSKSIEAYYREKFVPQLKQSGAEEVALADVSGKIRELLTQEKVNQLMVSWLQSLRSESQVSIPTDSDSPWEGAQTR